MALPLDAPAVSLAIGGSAVPGIVSLTLEQRGWSAAARFEVEVALGSAPLMTAATAAALQVAEVSLGLSVGSGFTNFLTGQVDNVRIDLLGNLAVLTGRDLAARLIDLELTETFNNRTSSQIAQTLAERCGLSADVMATSTPVGQYYEIDHARSALGLHARATTAWNLLCQLAQLEGFAVSVTGSTLSFGPPPQSASLFVSPRDFMALDVDRATTVPDGATVLSWNSRSKAVVNHAAGMAGGSTIVRPNLTAAQAGAVAASHLAALDVHRIRLNGVMPGELSLLPAAQLVLAGTNTGFDGSYTVDAVTRRIDARRGFTQTVSAYATTS